MPRTFIYLRTRGKANRDRRPALRSEIFIIWRLIRFARGKGDLVNGKSRWNLECALAARLKSRFRDSTCLPEESFLDGPVPAAALPRRYRARRMGIDSDSGGEESTGERRNRSKVGRGERIGIGEEGERVRAEIRITGTAARLEMPSQARGARREEKGSDQRKAPRDWQEVTRRD